MPKLLPALAFASALALGAAGCGLSGGGGGGAQTSSAVLQSNADVDWRDEVIYQVITDRFADGDVNNNWNVNRTALGRYQGGDWEGLIKKAGYLQELGVTTVWISPIVKNLEEDAGVAGYHGYWTQDFLKTNPHFGDLGALRRMVDELHKRDIKVIVDIVTNHIGPLFYYDINLNGTPEETFYGAGTSPGSQVIRVTEYDPDWDPQGIRAMVGGVPLGPAPVRWLNQPGINRVAPQPAMFQNEDWYHRKGRVVPDLNGTWPLDQVVLGDFPGGLKDLATERQDVRDAMVEVFGEWIRRVDFDGFRIDTIKHVEDSFWTDFCPRIRQVAAQKGKQNFLMFGEAFDGDDGVLARYTQHDMLDSVFYFSQKYAVMDGVIKHGGATQRIEETWGRKALYGQTPQPGGIGIAPARAMVTFIDNHDVARFQAGQSDDRRLRVALGFLATTEGIPCIYYGTEQGFSGAGDPANRERLWDTGYDTTGPLFQHTRKVLEVRREHVALRRGDTRIRWSTPRTGLEEDAGIFAFERLHAQETVLVCMNVNGQKSSRTSLSGADMQTSFPTGTVLVDLLDGAFSATVGAGGKLAVEVPSVSLRILVAR